MRIMTDYQPNYSFMAPCDEGTGDGEYAVTYGEIRDFGLNILPYDDAGIVEITEPVNPLQEGVRDIKAELTNLGTGDLTSCTIRWAIDGVEQNAYSWTGNLAQGESEIVTVGNYNFTSKQPLGSYKIEVWSALPNGRSDDEQNNDKAPDYFVNPSISPGTYFIGGTSNYHFATIRDAVIYLNSAGIQGNGTVNFQIRNGNYSGQFAIENINSNPINIYAENSGEVNINATLNDVNNNYIFNIDNSRDISVRGINFAVNSGSTYGRNIVLQNGTNNIEFENCEFTGIFNPARSWDYALIYSFDNPSSNHIFTNNVFNYGASGIVDHAFQEEGGNAKQRVHILNNEFHNFTNAAVQIGNADDVRIENNIMRVTSSISTKPRMAIESFNASTIKNNFISGISGNGSTYAINVIHNSVDNEAIVSENSITQCTNIGGIIVDGAKYGEIMTNEIAITNSEEYDIAGINLVDAGETSMMPIEYNEVTVDNCSAVNVENSNTEIYKNKVHVNGNVTDDTKAVIKLMGSSGNIALNHVTGGSINGIYLMDHSGNLFYNSVAVSSSADMSAFKVDSYQGYALRNQFVNLGAGYAFVMNNSLEMAITDENNYYAAQNSIGMMDESEMVDISDVPSMTGNDQNSASVDPMFESSFDLHLTAYNAQLFRDFPITEILTSAEHNKYQKYSWDGYDRDEMGIYYFGIDNIMPTITIDNHTKEIIACLDEEDQVMGVTAFADFGAEPVYQWQIDGMNIPNANSPVYKFPPMEYDMSGIYRCKITAPGVTEALYTKPIAVYVLSEPEITRQPQEMVLAPEGGYAKFEVDAHYRGIDLNDYQGPKLQQFDFQWYKWIAAESRAVELVDDDVIAGAESSVLTFNGIRPSDLTNDGDYYFAWVHGLCGSIQTEGGKINLLKQIEIDQQPISGTICADESTTLMVRITDDPDLTDISYQWYKDGQELQENANYAGVNTTDLELIEFNPEMEGTYACMITDNVSGNSVWSDDAEWTLIPEPVIDEEMQQYAFEVEAGNTLEIEMFVDYEGQLEYRWYNEEGEMQFELLEGNILTIENASADITGDYFLTITYECGDMMILTKFSITVIEGGISSVNDFNNTDIIRVTPNPATDIANFSFDLSHAGNAIISLHNAAGIEIAEMYNGFASQGRNEFNYDISNLPTGVYFYTLSVEGLVITNKLMIIK
jgi:hypothetical protein